MKTEAEIKEMIARLENKADASHRKENWDMYILLSLQISTLKWVLGEKEDI